MPPSKRRAADKKIPNVVAAFTPINAPLEKAAPAKASNFCPQTDALSRMTIELNMRAINFQAQRLEHDLSLLVKSTEKDKEFRSQHKSRMDEMWKELLAVKIKVGEVQGGQVEASKRYELCRQQTNDSIEEFRRQVGGFQTLCRDLSSQLESLPTMADLDLMATQPLPDDKRQISKEIGSEDFVPSSAQRQGKYQFFTYICVSLIDRCGKIRHRTQLKQSAKPLTRSSRPLAAGIESTRPPTRPRRYSSRSIYGANLDAARVLPFTYR
jgi:hypothetical protein